jgi:hypothetical protein
VHFACNRDRFVIACGAHDQGNLPKMKKSAFVRIGVLMTGFVFLSSCTTAPLTITPINTQSQSSQGQGTRVDTLYARGRDALMAGDLASALELFHSARRAGPDDVRVLNGLAVIYDRLGRYDLSANYYQSAQAIDPNSTIVQTNLALSTHMRAGQHAPTQSAVLEPPTDQEKPSWVAPANAQQPSPQAVPLASLPEVAPYAPVNLLAVSPSPRAFVAAAIEPSRAAPPQVQPRPLPVRAHSAILTRSANQPIQIRRVPTAAPINPEKPTWVRSSVMVINSTGVSGHAFRTANTLRSAGWQVSYVGNQRPYTMTTTLVTYGVGQRYQALTLARTLSHRFGNTPLVRARPSSDQIQIRLGRDTTPYARRNRQTRT